MMAHRIDGKLAMAARLLLATFLILLIVCQNLCAKSPPLEKMYGNLLKEAPEDKTTKLLAAVLGKSNLDDKMVEDFSSELPELIEAERQELLDGLQDFLEREQKESPQRQLAMEALIVIIEKETHNLQRKIKRTLISSTVARRETARLIGLTDGLSLSLTPSIKSKKRLTSSRIILERIYTELPQSQIPNRPLLLFVLLFVGVFAWYIGNRQGKSTPTPLDNRLLLAEVHFRNKHFAKALRAYQEVLADPSLTNGNTIRARLCLALAALGKSEAALVNLNEINLSTLDHAVVYELGKAFQKLGKYSTALDLFNNVYARARDYRSVAARIEELSQLSVANLVDQAALERILAPRYANPILLGKGAMGMVFKVKDRQLRQTVAVKIMSPLIGESQSLRKRFIREIKSLAALEHSGIVKILDFKMGDVPYYAMEFIEGRPLNRLITSGELSGRFDRISRIALFITDALAYASNQGVLHRDIKPANVLIVQRDRAKLIDFGVAKLRGATTLTAHEAAVGTPLYLAPEVLNGKQQDELSEIYALGVLLYEMVVGYPPWSFEQLMFRSNPSTPPIKERAPNCPQGLVDIITRCLEPEPEKRFTNLSELATELANLLKVHVKDSGIVTSP